MNTPPSSGPITMDVMFCWTPEVDGVDMLTSMTNTGMMPLHSHSRVDSLRDEQFLNDGDSPSGIVFLGLHFVSVEEKATS